jgi:Fe-S oxidoreductase/nitrate reductase gamma subunit
MPIRETFWNIPHWAEIGQYLFALFTVLVLIYGFYRRFQRWRAGQAENRFTELPKRIRTFCVQAIGQKRTVQDILPGLMHLAIFWGIAILFLGTALATIDWDVTHLLFGFQFLKDGFYVVYELVLDIFGIFLLMGLGYAIYRRLIQRPDRLQNIPLNRAWENPYILGILTFITLSGYLIEGLRIAVTQPDWAGWSPIGNAIAGLFLNTGISNNQTFHLILWISHTAIAFLIIGSIPFTKLFHIFATPLNIFTHSLEPKGKLQPAREGGSVGVKTLVDFTWKQLLNFDSCTRCGRCHDQCPVYMSGDALSPRDAMIKMQSFLNMNRMNNDFYGEILSLEEIWGCTTCYACENICPVYMEFISSIVDMRRHLVFEGEVDLELQDALSNAGRYGNVFGESPRRRAFWSRSVDPKIKDARREPVEYLWFVGDFPSFHPTLTEVSQKTAQVFQQAGVDFGILYDTEQNDGNDIRRVGEEGLYEMLTEKNLQTLAKVEYNKIITTDPHAYNTLKNEYVSFSNNGEWAEHQILHSTELLEQLITSKTLQFNKELHYKVTYSDPCYLGRYNGIYEAPRKVIEATGCELIEMPRNKDKALCCGAGGGRIWMEEGKVEERPSEMRVKEAASLDGVECFIVACPKDLTMYKDAVKTTGYEDQIRILDIIDLVTEAL